MHMSPSKIFQPCTEAFGRVEPCNNQYIPDRVHPFLLWKTTGASQSIHVNFLDGAEKGPL